MTTRWHAVTPELAQQQLALGNREIRIVIEGGNTFLLSDPEAKVMSWSQMETALKGIRYQVAMPLRSV